MNKKYVIVVEFKNYCQLGYFKSEECITNDKSKALVCNKSYADGLCRGINFGIKFYEDDGVKQAYVEELKWAGDVNIASIHKVAPLMEWGCSIA